MPDKELRALPVTELRVETREDGKLRLVGYAAVFEKWSEDLGGFREKIAAGAFAASLEKPDDIRSLYNHDPMVVLGRTANGTLQLREDGKGLRYEADLPDTQQARDVAALVQRGDVDGMSFMFRTRKDEWTEDKEKQQIRRTLIDVELLEAGPVVFPAYPQTKVGVRSLAEVAAEGREHLAAQVDPAEAQRIADEVDVLRTLGG